MREIKFRIWDDANNHMFFTRTNSYDESFVTMQFTGLKDKNGKEIYEGDMFKVTETNTGREGYAWVIWDEAQLTYDMDDNMKCGEYSLRWFVKNQEVIGNIYENPELLNE